MGDRGNVVVVSSHPLPTGAVRRPVYLYSHWGGSELPLDVQRALQRHQRWDHPAYLARILFCEILPAKEHDGEIGFGISPFISDNEHTFIVVEDERVRFVPYKVFHSLKTQLDKDGVPVGEGPSWTFDEYCGLSEEALLNAFNPRET